MTAPQLGNPAARLHSILAQAKLQSDGKTTREVWGSVLGTEPSNLPRLYYQLALLQELITEAEQRIRELDVEHEIYLQHFPLIRDVLAVSNFDSAWRGSKMQLTEAVLQSLLFCSERIRSHGDDPVIPANELDAIRRDVEELTEQIGSSKLAPVLKKALLDMLESMRRAISEYQIRGTRGLRHELFAVFARLEQNFDVIKANKDEPKLGAFWKILSRFDTLTSLYVNLPQLTAGFQALLPGGTASQ